MSRGRWSAEKLLATTHSEREAYYSPDGSQLAFISDHSGSLELWIAGADGTDPRRLTDSRDAVIGCPRWAPDGRRIAYQSTTARGCSLWVLRMTATGVETFRIHEDSADLLLSSRSHDGRALYFGSDRGGDFGVWRVEVSGHGDASLPVPILADGAITACESADGRWLYHSKVDRPGVWRRPAQGGADELVVADFVPRFRGNWALAEGALYFVQQTRAGLRVNRFDLETREQQTPCAAGHLYAPSFCLPPDTRALVVSMTNHGGADLNLVEGLDLARAQ